MISYRIYGFLKWAQRWRGDQRYYPGTFQTPSNTLITGRNKYVIIHTRDVGITRDTDSVQPA